MALTNRAPAFFLARSRWLGALVLPVDIRRKGEDGFFWQFGPALFACKAPCHLDRVRKNADPLLFPSKMIPSVMKNVFTAVSRS